jgi:hypothetical protein
METPHEVRINIGCGEDGELGPSTQTKIVADPGAPRSATMLEI